MNHREHMKALEAKRSADIHSAKSDADDERFDLERYLDEAEYRKDHEQPAYRGEQP